MNSVTLSRPSLWVALAVVPAIFAQIALCASSPATGCSTLNMGQRARLVDYVKKQYKVPSSTAITLGDVSFVSASCFRKLEFKSGDPKKRFKAQLYLSPDFRFLTTELLDSRIDPLLEAARKQQELNIGLTNGTFPSRGPKDAPVSIVIFSDFQCPYCRGLAHMLDKDTFASEGKSVRVIFRYFPLDIHDWSRSAAEATACAQEQGDDYFWRLHDILFQRQNEFTVDNVVAKLTDQAKQFPHFDVKRFTSCIASKRAIEKINRDVAFGSEVGVTGTPTLFINGERVDGISNPEQFHTFIREASAKSSKRGK